MPTADSAGIRIPPPLYFAAGLALGWVAGYFVPPPRVLPQGISLWMGGALIAISLILALSAIFLFRRARTTILPQRASGALVIVGPYRFTRNPMYLSLSIFYIGAAILFGLTWAFLLFPIVVLLIQTRVIAREEAYLERRFGNDYRQYRETVRRWI